MMYFKTPFRGGNLENNFFKIKSKKHALDQEKN